MDDVKISISHWGMFNPPKFERKPDLKKQFEGACPYKDVTEFYKTYNIDFKV